MKGTNDLPLTLALITDERISLNRKESLTRVFSSDRAKKKEIFERWSIQDHSEVFLLTRVELSLMGVQADAFLIIAKSRSK